MILKEDIISIAEDKIKSIDGYLVDVKVTPKNVIVIYFDRFDGVSLDHCLSISKYIEDKFDRDIEDYELTVCSAGLDKPFLVSEQYKKNIGKEVRVLLNNGKRKKGVILSYDDALLLEVGKKNKGKKTYNVKEILISKDEIKETKLKINFK